MSRICMLTMFALVSCLPLSLCLAQGTQPQRIKGWGTVVDPDGTCNVKEDKGTLTITIPITPHDLSYSGDYVKLNAPRVMQDFDGDFTIEVKVLKYPRPEPKTSSSGRYSFVSAGMVLWIDDKNFMRFERSAESKSLFAYMERFEDGKTKSKKQKSIADSDTILRLERDGKHLNLVIIEAGPGEPKLTVLQSEIVDLPAKLKIGVHAINTTTKTFAPQLTGLKITKN